MLGVVGHAQLPQAGKHLRGERFVQLDDIEIADLAPEPGHELPRGGDGANTHDPRRHRGRGHAKHPRPGSEAMTSRCVLACENERGGTVVNARGIPRRYAAALTNDWLEL